jgi:MFS family permease
MTETGRSGFKTVLANRDYRLLLGAEAISFAGDWIYGVALIAFVFERTRSPGWVAAASILRLLPYVLFGLIGGVVADRYDRRIVMIVSDVARAAVMFAVTVVVVAGAPVVVAIGLAFVSTAAGAPYGPALGAITPAIVAERDLAAANALTSSVEHLALVLGPAVGGILLSVGSTASAFAINGGTFLASAALVAAVRKRDQGGEREGHEPLHRQAREAFRAISSSTQVSLIVFLISAATFVYGAELVLLVLVSERLLGLGSEGLGLLTAFVGLGGIVAAGLTSRLAQSRRPGLTLAGTLAVAAFPLSLLAFTREPVVACLLLTIEGAGSIALEVIAITTLQRILDPKLIARVFGVLDSVTVVAVLAGSVLTPVLISWIGLRPTLIALGAGLAATILVAAPKLREVDRASRRRIDELATTVDLLAGTGVFDGAPRPTLEGLAAEAQSETVAPGTVVVREGDEAKDFFVVASGRLDVLSTGASGGEARKVNELKAGDYFGEIGLLEHMPRTATVSAAAETTMWRISGEAFLDAVNQPPSLSGTLLDGIVGRLARTHPEYKPVSFQLERAEE